MEIEESDDEGYPWPADMERRRRAALRKFYRNNPDYKPQEINGQQGGDRTRGGLSSATPVSPSVIEPRRTRLDKSGDNKCNRSNRWNLETTLELLEALKAYVHANKLPRIGRDMAKWTVIVANLTNPCGLELSHLARGSMSKLTEIRRYHRQGRLENEIQQSLFDYEKICDRYGALGSR